MKLAMESFVPVLHFGMERGLKLIKDAGFDAVDYSLYYLDEIGNLLDNEYLSRAKQTRAVMDEIGLPCCQAHAPFTIRVDAVLDESNPDFVQMIRALEFASILGAPHIVVHGLIGSSDPTSQEYEDLNYIYFKKLEPYCIKYGVKIAIENLRTAGCRTPKLHSNMLRRLGSSNFIGLVDLGHANLVGFTPAEFLLACDRGTIHGLHVHDNFGTNDDHLNPFSGSIDWAEAMHALAQIGYDGDFTMEVIRYMRHYCPDMAPEALRLAAATGRKLISMIH